MTATWTKALGFLSLPGATRSLQATERKGGREEGRDDRGRRGWREEKSKEEKNAFETQLSEAKGTVTQLQEEGSC